MNDEQLIWETYKNHILNEAIPLSIAKKIYTRKDLPNNYTPEMNKAFNNKDRIILPFNSSEKFYVYSDAYKGIQEFIENQNAENYRKCREHQKETGIYQNTYYEMSFEDYIKGYLTVTSVFESDKESSKTQKQIVRIGKFLQEMGQLDLLDQFKKDESRQLKDKDLVVVVSRHPYDIAGASTDRNWTTCISKSFKPIVYKGKSEFDYYTKRKYKRGEEGDTTKYFDINKEPENLKHQKCDEEDGAVILYLVPKKELIGSGDKIQLRKPLSRILFFKTEEGDFFPSVNDDEYIVGVYSKDFGKQAENWMASNLNYEPFFSVDESEDESEDD